MTNPPNDREMALLYLLYLGKGFIEEEYAGGSVPEVRARIEAELAAVGDEEWWWQYHVAQHEKKEGLTDAGSAG